MQSHTLNTRFAPISYQCIASARRCSFQNHIKERQSKGFCSSSVRKGWGSFQATQPCQFGECCPGRKWNRDSWIESTKDKCCFCHVTIVTTEKVTAVTPAQKVIASVSKQKTCSTTKGKEESENGLAWDNRSASQNILVRVFSWVSSIHTHNEMFLVCVSIDSLSFRMKMLQYRKAHFKHFGKTILKSCFERKINIIILSWKGEIWNEIFCLSKSKPNNPDNLIQFLESQLLFRTSGTLTKIRILKGKYIPDSIIQLTSSMQIWQTLGFVHILA